MNKRQLGKELLKELSYEHEIVKLARWAFKIYSNNCRSIDIDTREVLECLFSMEDDPQFEYTKQELELLAQKLINNQENPIEQVNEIKQQSLNHPHAKRGLV